MKVNKNTLKKVKRLIEDAMDIEKTPTFDESWSCLYEAIDTLEDLLESEQE